MGANDGSVTLIRWTQMLDMNDSFAYAKIYASINTGTGYTEYVNIFDFDMVYLFSGFQNSNVIILPDSSKAFTGVDTNWRDVWLCFFRRDLYKGIRLKFEFTSNDTIATVPQTQDGWMIDNFLSLS